MDKSVGGLAKARNADVYGYTVQDYDDSPDLFVGGADLKAAKQITTTNPFQSNYAWGKSEIVDYKTDKGVRLQGALYYPAGYEPGKNYPMIVYMYEKLSDGVHRYVAPSDRDYYNTTVFTSHGYFVFQPDIVFRPREPGLSVVECVVAGVKKVIVDGRGRSGARRRHRPLVGRLRHGVSRDAHQRLFAAAVAGAPITDLVSNYGNHHWSSGIAETDHIETGQQRMEVPLYEDLQAYIRELRGVQRAEHDGAAAARVRRRGRHGVLAPGRRALQHRAAREEERRDARLQRRGSRAAPEEEPGRLPAPHPRVVRDYLKSDQPAGWIAHGETFIERADEVKKLSVKR